MLMAILKQMEESAKSTVVNKTKFPRNKAAAAELWGLPGDSQGVPNHSQKMRSTAVPVTLSAKSPAVCVPF